MRQESFSRLARVEGIIDENASALEAMQTRQELIILRKPQRKRADSVRAVATGFGELSTEEEVRELSQKVIKAHAMEKSHEDTQCPTKPITLAFLHFSRIEMDFSE